jgi:hypothetical protein
MHDGVARRVKRIRARSNVDAAESIHQAEGIERLPRETEQLRRENPEEAKEIAETEKQTSDLERQVANQFS